MSTILKCMRPLGGKGSKRYWFCFDTHGLTHYSNASTRSNAPIRLEVMQEIIRAYEGLLQPLISCIQKSYKKLSVVRISLLMSDVYCTNQYNPQMDVDMKGDKDPKHAGFTLIVPVNEGCRFRFRPDAEELYDADDTEYETGIPPLQELCTQKNWAVKFGCNVEHEVGVTAVNTTQWCLKVIFAHSEEHLLGDREIAL